MPLVVVVAGPEVVVVASVGLVGMVVSVVFVLLGVVVVVVVVVEGAVVVELSGVLIVVDVAEAGGCGATFESVGFAAVGAAGVAVPMFCSGVAMLDVPGVASGAVGAAASAVVGA